MSKTEQTRKEHSQQKNNSKELFRSNSADTIQSVRKELEDKRKIITEATGSLKVDETLQFELKDVFEIMELSMRKGYYLAQKEFLEFLYLLNKTKSNNKVGELIDVKITELKQSLEVKDAIL